MVFERTSLFSGRVPARLPAALLGLLLLAGCGFSEGADWPALTVLEPVAQAPAAPAEPAAAAPVRPSLAGLLQGEVAAPPPGGGAVLVGLIRPLVVIRFPDAAPVAYEKALYGAVKSALERRPQTAFDVVAVTDDLGPNDQSAVTARGQAVLRALAAMGLPPERLSLSATSLPGVAGSEVHLYVR